MSTIRAAAMRIALISILLAPYLFFGIKDAIYHFVGRMVSTAEHVLHAMIALTIGGAIANAYRGRPMQFVVGVGIFLVVGAIDEYVYHHRLPEHESNLHAKGHMALLIFVVGSLAVNWLGDHNWRLPNIL